MNKSLVIAACLGLLLLAACAGRPNRCSQWGWYCPCDLIEGQGGCGATPNREAVYSPRAGEVVSREYAFPAEPCKKGDVIKIETHPAPAAAPAEMVPAAEPMPAPDAPPPVE